MTTLNVLATLTVTPDCTMLLVGNVALVALVALGSLVAGRISAARTMALAADTTPATAKTEQAVLDGNPCWSCSGTIESDDTCCDLTGSWATPSVCATIPVAAGEQAAPRADEVAWALVRPRAEAAVGALCLELDGQAVLVSESTTGKTWQVTDRFTDKVLAKVSATVARNTNGARALTTTIEAAL